jgi:ubiquinone/menaquinone biosynthesis C-methylase UbiE
LESLCDGVGFAAGVDPDWRSLLDHRMPEVLRVSGFAECLPFADQSFDLVICSWVLEHLARPSSAFAEAARVLRRAGHFVFLAPNAWHPLTLANRLISRFGHWQAGLVTRLYGRSEADTFPVVYRANTRRQVERLATAAGLTPVAFCAIGDPSYLAFNELFFRVAIVAEGLTPEWMKVHLIGDFVKGSAYDSS